MVGSYEDERGRRAEGNVIAMSGWGWFGTVIFVVIWIAIAFWPARVARRKGHSWLLYFIFSLFFFPAALIVAYVVKDRRGRYVEAGP
jgi:hypothetical protein